MGSLWLRYEEDDAPNQTGDLEVIVETRGFRAAVRSYVGASSLANFGRSLGAYPLTGSVFLEALGLVIAVRPHGSRGHLLVHSELASLTGSSPDQAATLEIETDYASIDSFARSVVVMAGQKVGEVLLQSFD